MDEAIPGSLLEDEPQVIIRPDGEVVVAHPAQFHRLAFQGFDEQMVDFVENAQCRGGAERFAALAKQPHGKRVHGVAGVHGDRHPDPAMHGGNAAP